MADNEQKPECNAKGMDIIKCPRCGHEQKPSETCVSCGLGLDYIPGIKRGDPAPIDVLFKEAWKLFKLRFHVLIIISIIYNLFVLATNSDAYFKKEAFNPDEIEYAKLFVGHLVLFIASAWSLGAYVSTLTEESLSMSEALAAGVRLLHSYLWLLFLSTLLIMLGLVVLIIPGIILFVRYVFGDFVLLCEGKKGYEALKQSARYVEGRWFSVFGRILPVWVISAALSFLPRPISLLIGTVFTPFYMAYLYTLYLSLRGEVQMSSSSVLEESLIEKEPV